MTPPKMKSNRRNWLIAAMAALMLVFGLTGSMFVLRLHPDLSWTAPRAARMLEFFLLAVVLIAIYLGLRFLRWNLLLRGIGVFVPERLNLRVYLSSFAFNFTPLYLGPVLYRVYFLKSEPDDPDVWRKVLSASIAELVFDLAGLAAVGLLGALLAAQPAQGLWLAVALLAVLVPPIRSALIGLFILLMQWTAWIVLGDRGLQSTGRSFPMIFRGGRFLLIFAISIVAWWIPPLLLVLATRALDGNAPLPLSMLAVAKGSIGGTLSAIPGGSGVTGRLVLDVLELGGGPVSPMVIVLYRLGTYWLVLLVGIIVLIAHNLLRIKLPPATLAHFETISEEYDAEIPETLRLALLERKTRPMIEFLLANNAPGGMLVGLDLGCGQGWYSERMEQSGHRMVGMDAVAGQVRGARHRLGRAVLGLADRLPFADNSFDFLFSINVLHHLPDRPVQCGAAREIQRVLKPGGVFFLHEINVLNPLYRFYMGYVFPVMRNIDTGVERWIRPDDWTPLDNWNPESIVYYTFLPDFLPAGAIRWFRPLEQWLERSRWRRFSAHYTARFVCRKSDRDPPAPIAPGDRPPLY